MIIGNSYTAMNSVILNKYGIHLPKPAYPVYSLEVANIGIQYNCIRYLSCAKYKAFVKDCHKEYPPDKYDLDIVIILTKEHFLSKVLKPYLEGERNLSIYLEDDIVLLKASNFEDLSEEYFKDDPTDLLLQESKVNDPNEANEETVPLIT